MPVDTKTISSKVRMFLNIAKAHMSLRTYGDGVPSVAGVYLVSFLQANDWARFSTQARHYFSTYISTTYQHQDSVQHVALGPSEEVAGW